MRHAWIYIYQENTSWAETSQWVMQSLDLQLAIVQHLTIIGNRWMLLYSIFDISVRDWYKFRCPKLPILWLIEYLHIRSKKLLQISIPVGIHQVWIYWFRTISSTLVPFHKRTWISYHKMPLFKGSAAAGIEEGQNRAMMIFFFIEKLKR